MYYQKHLKYKTKYQDLKYMTGGNYSCGEAPYNPCIDNINGKYQTKNECVKYCVPELSKLSKFHPDEKDIVSTEFNEWVLYLTDTLQTYPNVNIYIKGGAVIGLDILKKFVIYCDNDQDIFDKYYDDFVALNLIKDWDFTLYYNEDVTFYNNYNEFLEKSKKYNMNKEGEGILREFGTDGLTMIRYKTKNDDARNKIGSDDLFEMSIKYIEGLSSLEIPMTSMKIKLTIKNVKKIFDLMKVLYLNKINTISNIKIDYLDYIFNDLIVSVNDVDNHGLFYVTNQNFDNGGLSIELLNIIAKTDNTNEQQFIISQIKEPDRLFLRLSEKNIPKSNNIKNFFQKKLGIDPPEWTLDELYITKIVQFFIDNLQEYLIKIYNNNYKKNIDELHIEIDKLWQDKSKLQCKKDILSQQYDYDFVVNILNDIYNNSKNNPQIFNENLVNHKDYKIIIQNPIIKVFSNMKQMSTIEKKIEELSDNMSECNNLNIKYDDIKNENSESIIKNMKIIGNKLAGKEKELKKIYYDILIWLMVVFKNVNIGRLSDALGNFNIDTLQTIKKVFNIFIKELRVKYLSTPKEVAQIYNLITNNKLR